MSVITLRIKYKKLHNMKFLSHLELIKTMERAFRRMNLPMKFSQGFSPKPKISYAAPLPVGVESECEYLDVELVEKVDLTELLANQKQYLPNGLVFIEAKHFGKTNKLMALVTDSTYIIQFLTDEKHTKEDIINKVDHFKSTEEITYEKLNKKKQMKVINIKPLIQNIEVISADKNQVILKALLTTGSNGNLKPEKLVELLCKYELIDMIEGKDRYKRIELFARDKNNKLLTLFEV